MTKKPQKEVLDRDALLAKLKNNILIVEIPEWDASIRVQPPTFPRIQLLRLEAPDDAEFRAALVIACCVDLKEEDLRVMREGNGFRFSELLNAVYAAIGAKVDPGNS